MEMFDDFWNIYGNTVLNLGINGLLAISIYLTLSCGMLAMANAAFMGIGAYTAAILTMYFDAPFIVALAAGMITPSIVAFIIGKPTLRLSGVYLAMATLGFGEVVRIVILNSPMLAEKISPLLSVIGLPESATNGLVEMTETMGGALGMNGIPQMTEWWHVLLAMCIVLFVLYRMQRSRVGRAFEAIKEDETAAGLMGIHVTQYKMLAFVLGAAIAGLAGGLSAHLTFSIGPAEFGFDRGVEILTMTILGGISGLMGPLLGSTLITLLPTTLRLVLETVSDWIISLFGVEQSSFLSAVISKVNDLHLVINGLILVLVVLFLPKGIWDPVRFKRWFSKKRGG